MKTELLYAFVMAKDSGLLVTNVEDVQKMELAGMMMILYVHHLVGANIIVMTDSAPSMILIVVNAQTLLAQQVVAKKKPMITME